jgi:hypothetical protein
MSRSEITSLLYGAFSGWMALGWCWLLPLRMKIQRQRGRILWHPHFRELARLGDPMAIELRARSRVILLGFAVLTPLLFAARHL